MKTRSGSMIFIRVPFQRQLRELRIRGARRGTRQEAPSVIYWSRWSKIAFSNLRFPSSSKTGPYWQFLRTPCYSSTIFCKITFCSFFSQNSSSRVLQCIKVHLGTFIKFLSLHAYLLMAPVCSPTLSFSPAKLRFQL